MMPLSAQAGSKIQEIEVTGAQRIEPDTVLSYLGLHIGDELSQNNLDYALKSLFATGLFADVSLGQEGDVLKVSVIENPVVNEIAFEGNDKIGDEELLAEIRLRPRQVFTRTQVQGDVSRMHQLYHRNGRFAASIEPKVIKLDQNRVNLVFEIQEGAVTKVRSVRFVGNKRFDDSRLRTEISTKETAWYRFITADDRYDPDRLSYDQELLRRFYMREGYADFQLLSSVAELSNDRSEFFITFTIEEGERYKFGEINLNSQLRDFDTASLEPQINIESDDWYDADRVQEASDRISDALGDMQYAFVNVRPNIERDRENRLVNIAFDIQETPQAFVERIDVNGNVRTLDKVIRREIMVVEGDPFNKSKLARSEQKIRNLDYFEKVDMQVKPGSAPDKTVVDIEVAEKSTGELSIGAGFSTSDGPLADFRIRERNFLGKGQDLLLATVLAGERTEFDLSFTEPHFLDRDLSAGIDLFHVTRDLQRESSYDQRRSGGALRVGYPLSARWRQTLKYSAERNEIRNVKSGASRFITDQEGIRDTSAIGLHTSYDSRDSKIFPTEGWLLWLNTEMAGLGGDAQYVSAKTGASFYYPLYDQWVLNLMGEVAGITGYGDKDVVINERFFMGGNSLRGFAQAGVGPRDSRTGDSLGGNTFYRGTAETSFPLGLDEELGILGHAFTDVGSLWSLDESGPEIQDESSIRASLGLGLSWRSPFGPIRMDYAVPVAKEDYDDEEKFRFNFGTRF